MTTAEYLTTAGLVTGVLILTACSGRKGNASGGQKQNTTHRSQYIKMKPEEAKKIMETDEKLILVDVRTQEEYAENRIGSAINIPLGDIGAEQPERLPNPDAPIMVYCRSGVRSKRAAKKLLELGYKNIIDIGGIMDWPYK